MRTIALEGMQFEAFHGYYPEERVLGGKYVVDVWIDVLPGSPADDDLEKTINYETIFLVCKQVMAQPVSLLETVIEKIGQKLRLHFKNIAVLKIKVHKLHPPLGGLVAAATLTDHFDYRSTCSKCQQLFICYVADTCWCKNVQVDPLRLAALKETCDGCLCERCLEVQDSAG